MASRRNLPHDGSGLRSHRCRFLFGDTLEALQRNDEAQTGSKALRNGYGEASTRLAALENE